MTFRARAEPAERAPADTAERAPATRAAAGAAPRAASGAATNAAAPAPLGARAARRRAAILAAAEASFAERGYAAARLEDVAERVGVRRASLVYYFRDKRELYEAVLAGVFGDLLERSRAVLDSPAPLAERLETAAGMFVDFLADRPTFGALLLREIADGPGDRYPGLDRHVRPFFEIVESLLRERSRSGDPSGPVAIDAAHFASAVAGVTVFFSTAMPALAPRASGARDLGTHRAQVLEVARRLLGIAPEAAGPDASGARAPREGARRGRGGA